VPPFGSTPDAVLWRKLCLRAVAEYTPAATEPAATELAATVVGTEMANPVVEVYWNPYSGALLPPGETPPADADVRKPFLT